MRPLILVLICCLISSSSYGQEHSERRESISAHYRQIMKAGERLNFPVPALLDEEEAYVISINARSQDADIELFTGPEVNIAELETLGNQIAHDLNAPLADFYYRDRPLTRFVDVEFNDYIHPNGSWAKSESRYRFQLGTICQTVRKSKLGKKAWVVYIDPTGADEVVATAPFGSLDQKYGAFLKLKEVPASLTVDFSTSILWYHAVLGWIGSFACVGVMVAPLWSLIRVLKRVRSGRVADPAPPNLDAVQRQTKYNQLGWKNRLQAILASLPFVVILGLRGAESGFEKVVLASPLHPLMRSQGAVPPAIWIMLAYLPVALISGWIISKQEPKRKKPPSPLEKLMPRLIAVMLVPIFLLIVFRPFIFGTNLVNASRTVRLAVALTPLLLILGVLIYVVLSTRRALEATKEKLRPGDLWYDVTQEIAAQAAVKINSVSISSTLPHVNAMVSLGNRVTLTRRLVELLKPNEVRAVIAHEVAHVKKRHLYPRLALTLVELVCFFSLIMWARGRVSEDIPFFGAILHSPILFYIGPTLVAPLWRFPRSRKNEFEADRIAAELTGDADSMIIALLKMTEGNHGVHAIRKGTERWMTHPSIRLRIEALRSAFPGAGAFLSDDPSGAFLINDPQLQLEMDEIRARSLTPTGEEGDPAPSTQPVDTPSDNMNT